ncbi:DUF1579 family protein [Amycolatopsis saalfeldensis]|uniref:DUF1579 domain-containing protein n=1 Tax=Amycolatopsis saalfeldensis TaxID=394193 RepID=A0A1H8YMZ7_9PSEU|nr:DUF1579 family protein [Amycolatopsis saalfeldensis]SEP53557.1 Protein of unknown function [Amycolatopsis saalfeldensis]
MTTGLKPDQMKELDFLLGTWKCDAEVSMQGLPAKSQMVGVIHPIHDGKWYQWDIQSLARAGRTTWVAGWNPAASNFQVYFYDNHGLHGSEASVGSSWESGKLKFTGTMYTHEGKVEVIDEFTRIDENSFHDDFYIRVNDEWKQVVHGECYRLVV